VILTSRNFNGCKTLKKAKPGEFNLPATIAKVSPCDLYSSGCQERAYDFKRTTIAFQLPAANATPAAGSGGHPKIRGGAD
jgi:hypothetical protein